MATTPSTHLISGEDLQQVLEVGQVVAFFEQQCFAELARFGIRDSL